MGTCLNQELVSPAVQGLKALRAVNVIDQHTAIGSTVECHTQRLEPFLSGSIPELIHP